jgi:hypothetical protein
MQYAHPNRVKCFLLLAKLNVFAAYAPKDRHIFVYSSNKQINVGKD